MLNLVYLYLDLPSDWTARFDPEFMLPSLHSRNGLAEASMMLYSAGKDDFEKAMEEFYGQLSFQFRRHGLHFDDLSEDFDFEMLTEVPTESRNTFFLHTFIRLCEDIIVRVDLRGYRPEEEESVRLMLTTLQRSDLVNTASKFEPLIIPIDQLSWDWLGEIAVYNGGS